MLTQSTLLLRQFVLIALLVCTTVCALANEQGGPPPAEPITIMTRNVYVGADIFRVVNADPVLIVPTIAEVYATVVATNFAERAQVLADEVALHEPHIIGLQEVALTRRQSPGDVFFGNPEPAMEPDMDFLAMYLQALGERGLNYVVVASVDNADIELPLITDDSLDDIRLTDRDVLLVRGDLTFDEAETGNYSDNVEINLSGAVINFNRGYTRAAVTIGGVEYVVLNTHLEVGGQPEVQGAQADELIAMLASETRPVLVMGDINASPQDPPVQAYARLATAGYVDIWNERVVDDNDPGLTCCFSETLDDPAPAFAERIDVIVARTGRSTSLAGVEATVLGTTQQTASGLWPSDHAGVVTTMRVLGPGDDGDGDDVTDFQDNCVGRFNPNQRDTDEDGFGNLCDADFDQDNVVNFRDLGSFRILTLSNDPDADFNGDGNVNAMDLGILRTLFFAPPGPSGLVDNSQ
ncbi:MAG: endonuclease/exonuclease/phosphatase family protein [Gammaproteobacteria bacterium]